MEYIEKIDFALSFFIGCDKIDLITGCKTEEEIQELLINKKSKVWN